MDRFRVTLLVLLTVAPLPVAAGSSAAPAADGEWSLSFDVHSAEAQRAFLALRVSREDIDGTREGSRDVGWADLPSGHSVQNVSFLPAEGAGQYNVTLLVGGVEAGTMAFEVTDSGATARISFDVPDEPTYLNLTSEEVNADNKLKSPGEALVTRATVSDRNGVGDVDAIDWHVERDGVVVDSGTLPAPANAANTSATIEHRYARSPLAAGSHRLTLVAMHRDAVAATASRTFVIRDVATTLAAGQLAAVVPDEAGAQDAFIVLADRNGAPASALEARVYRGSARGEGAGLVATLGAPAPLPDADGAGRAHVPLTLAFPARAAAGAYRVSIYVGGSLVGSLPFDVRELPTLVSANATSEGGALRIALRGEGNGTLAARVGQAPPLTAAFTDGAGEIVIARPARGEPLSWNVTLHARADGPALASRNGTWAPPLDGPRIVLTPHHARGRLPAAWAIAADGWGLDNLTIGLNITRWDGLAEPRVRASIENGRLRLDGPPDLEAGRYDARLLLAWPNGSASETTWSFEAGPWTRVTLGAAVVENGTVRVPVRNDGGRAITRLVVEADSPPASWRLEGPAGARTVRSSGARAVFRDVVLAPGEEATLSFPLPAGPRRSGQQVMMVRVLAPVGP